MLHYERNCAIVIIYSEVNMNVKKCSLLEAPKVKEDLIKQGYKITKWTMNNFGLVCIYYTKI